MGGSILRTRPNYCHWGQSIWGNIHSCSQFRNLLGLDPKSHDYSISNDNCLTGSFAGKYQCFFAQINDDCRDMYVHTNILKYSMVEGICAPILKVVNINQTYDKWSFCTEIIWVLNTTKSPQIPARVLTYCLLAPQVITFNLKEEIFSWFCTFERRNKKLRAGNQTNFEDTWTKEK